ncbi:MAG: hypothetical protein V4477_16950 [Pseudomonadota bacterium]
MTVNTTTWFEAQKRIRNVSSGCKEMKGLKDGFCNRRSCQAELVGNPQFYMSDHETATDGRLYYCEPCAIEFNKVDDRFRLTRRCTAEAS